MPGTAHSWQREEVVSYDEAFKRELVEFADCIATGREPRTSAADGLRDMRLAEAVARLRRRYPCAIRLRNGTRWSKNTLLRERARRVVVGVGALAVDQDQVALRDVRLLGQLLCVEQHARRRPARRRTRRSAGVCGSRRPIVECTSSTACAGLAMPLSTARVSSVSRCGKYHSVPSALLIPIPENIVAKRLIGVSAPVPSQPCRPFFVVVDTPLPRWRLRRDQARRRGSDVQRVAVLAEVGDRHRRLQVSRQQPGTAGRATGSSGPAARRASRWR